MKGLFFVLAFLGFVGFSNLNAQCAKSGASCCSKKTAAVDTKVSAEEMAKVASADKTIKSKKEKDGTIADCPSSPPAAVAPSPPDPSS